MAKRYVGSLVITIKYVGVDVNNDKIEYKGSILNKDTGISHEYTDIHIPGMNLGYDGKRTKDYDYAANILVNMVTYYTSENGCKENSDIPESLKDIDFNDEVWLQTESARYWDDKIGYYAVDFARRLI
jgi:hypothetical protein